MPPPLPSFVPLLARRAPLVLPSFAPVRPSPLSLLPPRPFAASTPVLPLRRPYSSSNFPKPKPPGSGGWADVMQPVLQGAKSHVILFGGIGGLMLALYLVQGVHWGKSTTEHHHDTNDDLPYTEPGFFDAILRKPSTYRSKEGLKEDGAFAEVQLKSVLEQRSTVGLVRRVLEDWLIEPVLTTLRFLHLAALFVPVILLVPAVWVGPRERLKNGDKGDRSGAIWWYGVLVAQMQRAGPSFIKVCTRSELAEGRYRADLVSCWVPSSARSMGRVEVGSVPRPPVRGPRPAPLKREAALVPAHEASD